VSAAAEVARPRFQAEQPSETRQSDFTHWHLANGVDVEVLCWIDDHSRFALSITAHLRVTGHTCSTPSATRCANPEHRSRP
jgi:hypothetical protein